MEDADYSLPDSRKQQVQLRDYLRRAKEWIKSHRWLAFKIAVVLLLSLVVLAWIAFPYVSENEAFRRSRPALEAYAARVKAEGPAAFKSPPQSLGYFRVYDIQPMPDGFAFASDYGNPFDWDGIAYSTEPLLHDDYDQAGELLQTFTHIDGNWYWVWRPDPDRFVNGVPTTRPTSRPF